jgi:hypothetical protein
MKKLLILFTILFQVNVVFGQNIALEFSFIDAKNPGVYDDHLNTYFKGYNQKLIDDGQIMGWHVWKVINGPQEPYTHVVVSIYDLDKMDDDYTSDTWAERMPNITQSHREMIGQSIGENRKIVGTTTVVNVAEVLQKGVTEYPDVVVMNLMKAKHGKYKSYEDLEISLTPSIPDNAARKGWSLAKRIDRIGTEMSWTHFTVDWYDTYSDYLKEASQTSKDADKTYEKMMKLRDLTDRVVLEKFIFLNK